MLQEWHYFYQNTLRWRNLRKITIAQVHGTVYAAGLTLDVGCDLIVAADTVKFADPPSACASGCVGWSTSPTPGVRVPAGPKSSC